MSKSSLNRRQFFSSASAAAATAAVALNAGASPAQSAKPGSHKPLLMKLGDQTAPTTTEHLQYLARYSVKNVCGYPQIADNRLYATVDELKQMIDLAAKCGISVDMIAPPFLASIPIDEDKHGAIMLGKSPERDQEIEALQTLIKNCAAAGIPAIKYNLVIVGDQRIARTPGRGDTTYATWKFSEAHPPSQFTRTGDVTADESWERITYFLDRVIPVANEYKIRMALHPDDPGMPPQGYMGDRRVLGTVDGLKRFISIQESPYHGLNFCQGTVSEMLADPGKEIFDVIRYFGTRDKIFNVHFRNIRGHRDDFVETYPDEGDVDFVKAIQAYKEVGYKYMLMPDHVPVAQNDHNGLQSFAYCYGYIRALLQSAAELS
jgi:mannonate dehydratase